MKYKIWDEQLNSYAFHGHVFPNKTAAVNQLISFFKVGCMGDLTKIRAELWKHGEFAELCIRPETGENDE